MSEALRPRRSVLYMPGANERALEKAKGIPADALILDLEDAVAPDAKAEARARVCAAAANGEYGAKEIAIRINGIGTQWHADDIAAAAAAGPNAIVVPKVNSAEEVVQLVASFEAAGAPAHTKLWAMLETPVAILNAESIATASDRLTVLVMGTNDLAKELYAEHVPGRAPLQFGLQKCLMAARLAGKVILDGVYNDIKDDEGFRAESLQGKQFGFDGKTLIHPAQIALANRAFAPSAERVAWAEAVIAAFAQPENADKGAIRVQGEMVERLHLSEAERIVALAR